MGKKRGRAILFSVKHETPIRVVLADDSPVVSQKLGGFLADQKGIEVVAVTQNAVETIEAIRANRPHAVILDLRMPQGGGLRVLKEFSTAEWRPVMIVLTNYSSPQFRESCMTSGADFFLDKSTEFTQIPSLLSDLSGSNVFSGQCLAINPTSNP